MGILSRVHHRNRRRRNSAVGAHSITPRAPGETAYRPLALDVLRIQDGLVAEITSFVSPGLFAAFDLPECL